MNSSLRLRLVAIILVPLLCIAVIIGTWAVYDAQDRASTRFDRSLLAAVLAVSRDVALSGGDALSPRTSALLQDTSGGPVFYHVYAPDGVFVTGYATPPVPDDVEGAPQNEQFYFDGTYQGREVRGLRFFDATQIEGLSGDFTFTVWQDTSLRSAIVRDLSLRTFLIMSSLVATVAFVVWFGVRVGLRPLVSLEQAIARRSPEDLAPIQRKVPEETKGIVNTLNRLLGQVGTTIRAKDVFVSNAAHQLRNPIAGVVAMSEAVASARSLEQMRERSVELVSASREIGDLANKLLTLERASAAVTPDERAPVDLSAIVTEVCARLMPRARERGVGLTQDMPAAVPNIRGDATMIREALTNLIENALSHGGPDLRRISVTVQQVGRDVVLGVEDDGQGIPADLIDRARERFGQVAPSDGSGLGLAIAEAVAEQHGGRMDIRTGGGLSVRLHFPVR